MSELRVTRLMLISLGRLCFGISSRSLLRYLSSEVPSQGDLSPCFLIQVLVDAVGTVPCGILKNQPDPPLKADEEYPDWLWSLLDRQPTLKELKGRYIQSGEQSLTPTEVRTPTPIPWSTHFALLGRTTVTSCQKKRYSRTETQNKEILNSLTHVLRTLLKKRNSAYSFLRNVRFAYSFEETHFLRTLFCETYVSRTLL